MIAKVLTGHRAPIAVSRCRLVSKLLRSCTRAVAKVCGALISKLVGIGGLPIAIVCNCLVSKLLRSRRLTIAVIRDALISELLCRRTIAIGVSAYALVSYVLASGLSLCCKCRKNDDGYGETFVYVHDLLSNVAAQRATPRAPIWIDKTSVLTPSEMHLTLGANRMARRAIMKLA